MSLAADQSPTMLHIIYNSLSESPALEDCLSAITAGSALLLIQNAVYDEAAACIVQRHNDVQIYALKADLLARGIDENRLPETLQVVDYDGFVDLVERHNPIQSWF